MARHPRLGAGSALRHLTTDVLFYILRFLAWSEVPAAIPTRTLRVHPASPAGKGGWSLVWVVVVRLGRCGGVCRGFVGAACGSWAGPSSLVPQPPP